MAKNLRAKIPDGDILTVFDVNTASTEQLVKESQQSVRIAKNPREVAEHSVSIFQLLFRVYMMSLIVLSMI